MVIAIGFPPCSYYKSYESRRFLGPWYVNGFGDASPLMESLNVPKPGQAHPGMGCWLEHRIYRLHWYWALRKKSYCLKDHVGAAQIERFKFLSRVALDRKTSNHETWKCDFKSKSCDSKRWWTIFFPDKNWPTQRLRKAINISNTCEWSFVLGFFQLMLMFLRLSFAANVIRGCLWERRASTRSSWPQRFMPWRLALKVGSSLLSWHCEPRANPNPNPNSSRSRSGSGSRSPHLATRTRTRIRTWTRTRTRTVLVHVQVHVHVFSPPCNPNTH